MTLIKSYTGYHIPTGEQWVQMFSETDMMYGDKYRLELIARWNQLGGNTWKYWANTSDYEMTQQVAKSGSCDEPIKT